MVQPGGEIEMALPGLALLIGVESVVPELNVLKLPTIARKVFHALTPLVGRERRARPDRLVQFNVVTQALWRPPFSQDDFTHRKPGDKAEFIGGAIKRIPERFKSPATALRKHLPAPNIFVRVVL